MLEDEIRNELDSYEIKTTSKMILDRMNNKQSKRKYFNYKLLAPAFALAGISAASLIILMSLNVNNTNVIDTSSVNGTTAVALTADSLESQLALEVLYAGSMDSNKNNENQMVISLNRGKTSNSEYTKIIDNIDIIYPLFDSIDEAYDNLTIYYEGGEFEKLGQTYNYKYIIGEYILYSDEYFVVEDKNNIDLESEIALELGDSVYSGELKIEKETTENETEFDVNLSYMVGENIVKIEREVETDGDEFETAYTYKVEGDSYYFKKKVSLKEENGVKKFKYKLEDYTNNIYETLKLKESDGGYKITYYYYSDDEEYYIEDGNLSIEDGKRIYTFDDYTETRN